MIAKNAQETIAESLSSLLRFDEVLLYLNHSLDNTKQIALGYQNVKIIEGDFLGFGDTKNQAASCAKYDWILSLDSDEILDDALIDEIVHLDLDKKNIVYNIKRDNYFLGYKTQSQDVITRLYHKHTTKFNRNRVHEKVIIPKDCQVETLKHSFIHLNIIDINQTLTKIIHYTDLGAEGKKTCFFATVIAKSLFAFFKTYILQGNILKGWIGYVLAVNSANKRHYKYLKQYIHCQEEKKGNR